MALVCSRTLFCGLSPEAPHLEWKDEVCSFLQQKQCTFKCATTNSRRLVRSVSACCNIYFVSFHCTPPTGKMHHLHPPCRSSAPLCVSSAICVPKTEKLSVPFHQHRCCLHVRVLLGKLHHYHCMSTGLFFFFSSSCDITFLFVDTSMELRKCNTNPKECRLFWSPSHLLWLPDVRSHTNILD